MTISLSLLKNSKLFSLSLSIWFQIFLSAGMLYLLKIFLTGRPAAALFPLWGNSYEVKNTAIYLSIILVVPLVAILKKKNIYFLGVVLAALFMTAGPAATAWALLSSLATVAVGYQVVGPHALPILGSSNIGRFALAFWIGKAIYLLLLSFLSFFPINTRFMHGCVITALFLLSPSGVAEMRRVLGSFLYGSRIGGSWFNDKAISAFFLLLALLLLIFAAIHAGFDGDAATMHMRIAREMLNKGFWAYDVSEYGFAVMPLAPQFNFSAMFLVGGVEAVKVELLFQFLMTVALVVTGGGFRVSSVGLAMGSVLCATPMFVREIASLFVDVTLCGFMLASAVLVACSVRRKSFELAIYAALCAAGSMAAKNFGLLLVPFVFFALMSSLNSFLSLGVKPKAKLAIVLIAAIAFALFFYVVAWVKTSNPVFPFFNGLFKSSYWDASNLLDIRWIDHLSWDLLWRITFESSLFEESVDGSMGLSILFMVFCGLSLFAVTRRTLVAAIPLCIGLLYLIAVGVQIQYLRYFLPGFLLVATSLTYYLRGFMGRPYWPLWFVTVLSLFAANLFAMPSGRFTNGMMHIPIENRFIPGSWRGVLSANFQEEVLNGHKYIGDILNSSVREVPTVLLLGCPYGAYFNGRTIYTTWLNHSWRIREPQLLSDDEFSRYLITNNVTHIVLDARTISDQRAAFIPLVKAHSFRITALWGVELYQVHRAN